MSGADTPDDALPRRLLARRDAPGMTDLGAVRATAERLSTPGLGLGRSPLARRLLARRGEAAALPGAAGELVLRRGAAADPAPDAAALPLVSGTELLASPGTTVARALAGSGRQEQARARSFAAAMAAADATLPPGADRPPRPAEAIAAPEPFTPPTALSGPAQGTVTLTPTTAPPPPLTHAMRGVEASRPPADAVTPAPSGGGAAATIAAVAVGPPIGTVAPDLILHAEASPAAPQGMTMRPSNPVVAHATDAFSLPEPHLVLARQHDATASKAPLAPLPPGELPTMPAPQLPRVAATPAPPAAAHPAGSASGEHENEDLSERVARDLRRRLMVERERQGLPRWPR